MANYKCIWSFDGFMRPQKMKSSGHMDVVIDAARRAAAAGEVPVAAAVIDASGQIIVLPKTA